MLRAIRVSRRFLLPSLLLFTLTTGCEAGFDPYNELLGFRLLAIRAESPVLFPGESTDLSALVHAGSATEYDWSWCPFRAGADTGFECVVTEEELQAAIDREVGSGVVDVPSFQLGTSSTAAFRYEFNPALLEGLCASLRSQDVPDFVELPDCGGSFEISIRLDVRAGEESITGLKAIDLVYDPELALTNENPTILGASVDGSPLDTQPMLVRDKEVQLRLDIPEDTAELLDDGTRERLVVTWFVEGGDTDKARTSYLSTDPNSSFEGLRENLWTPPRAADFPSEVLNLYFVIRDGRRGIGWYTGRVRLEAAQ